MQKVSALTLSAYSYQSTIFNFITRFSLCSIGSKYGRTRRKIAHLLTHSLGFTLVCFARAILGIFTQNTTTYVLSFIVNMVVLRRLTFSMDVLFRHYLTHENGAIRSSFLPVSIAALIVLLVVACVVSSSILPSTAIFVYVFEVHIPSILSELVVAAQASISTYHYSVSLFGLVLVSRGTRYCELLRLKRLQENVDYKNSSVIFLRCLQIDRLTDITGLSARVNSDRGNDSDTDSLRFFTLRNKSVASAGDFDFDSRGSGGAIPMQTNPMLLYKATESVGRGGRPSAEMANREIEEGRISMVNPLHLAPEQRQREIELNTASRLSVSDSDSRPSMHHNIAINSHTANPLQRFGNTRLTGTNPLSVRSSANMSKHTSSKSDKQSSDGSRRSTADIQTINSSDPPGVEIANQNLYPTTISPAVQVPPPPPPPPPPATVAHVVRTAGVEGCREGDTEAVADAVVLAAGAIESRVDFDDDAANPSKLPIPPVNTTGRRRSVTQLASMFEGGGSSEAARPFEKSALAEAEAVLKAPARRGSVVKLTEGYKDIVRADAARPGQLNPLKLSGELILQRSEVDKGDEKS